MKNNTSPRRPGRFRVPWFIVLSILAVIGGATLTGSLVYIGKHSTTLCETDRCEATNVMDWAIGQKRYMVRNQDATPNNPTQWYTRIERDGITTTIFGIPGYIRFLTDPVFIGMIGAIGAIIGIFNLITSIPRRSPWRRPSTNRDTDNYPPDDYDRIQPPGPPAFT